MDGGAFAFILNDDEDVVDSNYHLSDVLKNAFYNAAEAIYNSNSTKRFERDLLDYLNKITNKARGDCDSNLKQRGKRVSMMPPNSKQKKTHGTAHMM